MDKFSTAAIAAAVGNAPMSKRCIAKARPEDASRIPASRFKGRRAITAAFVVAAFGWGVGFYGPPVYLEAVQQARGWSLLLTSWAVTFHFLVGVVAIANLPRLQWRFGLPAVTFAGSVVLAAGVIGWAIAQTPWQLFTAAAVTGAGWPALGAVAVNAIVAPWYVVKRPAALSIAYNGASIGGVVFSPLWVVLIRWVGFASAALIVGAAMIVSIALLALCILPVTPAKVGQVADGDARATPSLAVQQEAAPPVANLARDPAFLTISLGMALALFAQIGLIAQFVSLFSPRLGLQWAGVAAGLSTGAAVVGRLLVGWWMPPGVDRRYAAAASLAVQMTGCGLMLASGSSDLALFLGVILFGLGIGNATSLPPLIVQAEFATADTLRVVALTVAISQGAYAFAPAVFGVLRQVGSSHTIFAVVVAIQVASAAVYLLGRDARRSHRPVEACRSGRHIPSQKARTSC